MEEKKFKPIKKSRFGRFQVTVWERPRIISVGGSAADGEREKRSEFRASIQHSEFNEYSKIWMDRVLWCNPEELLNLARVLEKLNRKGEVRCN